ncbi:hypothetical protein [Streptomyces sp. NBC_00669]|uniref:hypothetical protein n=1 Tax=Streptomyces sp. NBC_00669 TaxID=2976011 RepID=UPI002E31486C|nr:hypothetical protein [Streptomyces sp. NBC_00669]
MSKQTLGPGDLLVRTGAITFLVGTVGTVVTVAPLLLHTKRLPTPAYFVSMLMGLGLALALVGLLKSALAQRHATAGGAGGTAVLGQSVVGKSGIGQQAAGQAAADQAAAER